MIAPVRRLDEGVPAWSLVAEFASPDGRLIIV
jgi:hypothetical protein